MWGGKRFGIETLNKIFGANILVGIKTFRLKSQVYNLRNVKRKDCISTVEVIESHSNSVLKNFRFSKDKDHNPRHLR